MIRMILAVICTTAVCYAVRPQFLTDYLIVVGIMTVAIVVAHIDRRFA